LKNIESPAHDQILDKHTIVDMFLMTSHDQILDKHTIVDMFCSHDQIIDKHTIVDMFCSHDQILDKHAIVDMFLMMSHDQILDKHTIVDMFLMMSHDQILDKHTIVDMFCSKCTPHISSLRCNFTLRNSSSQNKSMITLSIPSSQKINDYSEKSIFSKKINNSIYLLPPPLNINTSDSETQNRQSMKKTCTYKSGWSLLIN
jgi:hypothetical protein